MEIELVCVNNGRVSSDGNFATLTVGKRYFALNSEENWISIGIKVINDEGSQYYYNVSRFMKLYEYRLNRLESLGI